MSVKLLTKHHLEFLSLKGGCKGLCESTLAKMPHCWKSHAAAHFCDEMKLSGAHLYPILNYLQGLISQPPFGHYWPANMMPFECRFALMDRE